MSPSSPFVVVLLDRRELERPDDLPSHRERLGQLPAFIHPNVRLGRAILPWAEVAAEDHRQPTDMAFVLLACEKSAVEGIELPDVMNLDKEVAGPVWAMLEELHRRMA